MHSDSERSHFMTTFTAFFYIQKSHTPVTLLQYRIVQ